MDDFEKNPEIREKTGKKRKKIREWIREIREDFAYTWQKFDDYWKMEDFEKKSRNPGKSGKKTGKKGEKFREWIREIREDFAYTRQKIDYYWKMEDFEKKSRNPEKSGKITG